VPRRLLLVLVLLAALASGCARTTGAPAHTAEVQHSDAGGFVALVWHFFVPIDPYDRALWVHDGPELREEMERYFAGRPRAVRIRIADVEKGDGRAVLTVLVAYADGSVGTRPVVVTKGEPACLVDWPATRALWE
jgi:hypothetical protein